MRKQNPDTTFPFDNNFLLIDIQTTGIRPSKDRITKIELYSILNGCIDTEWKIDIHPDDTSNKNQKTRPFGEIASKLNKLFKNKIIVAHNAYYTYSFLKHEMLRHHIVLDEKFLCSISLSKYLFPESKQHTLQAISQRLSLDVKDKSPILLLLGFFSKLEEMMTLNDVKNAIVHLTRTPDSILEIDHKANIPDTAGIYCYYDKNNTLIYVGQSDSLSRSIFSQLQLDHNSHKEIQLHKQIEKVKWIKSHGEFGTALLAASYIKKYKPLFNRLLEKEKSLFTLQLVNNGAYLALKIRNISTLHAIDFVNTFGVFKNKNDLTTLLNFFINTHNLCYKVNALEKTEKLCFRFHLKKCNGACNNLEESESYNQRVTKIIKTFIHNKWPFKNPIAIKEKCAKTSNVNYHFIYNWTYLETATSVEKSKKATVKNSKMDVRIYQLIKNFMDNDKNYSDILEIKN